MKVLLDENLPKKLKIDLQEFEVFTVRDKDWNGKKNGELLALLVSDNFDELITFDKNLQYQQNFKKYSIPVLVLNALDNTHITLCKLVPQIKIILNSELKPGPIEIKVMD